jgi:sarcosine oxidase, subunit alpha
VTRLPTGGSHLDRSAPRSGELDGEELTGFAGDTLASALVAAGRLEVAPSIYRRRPRGLLTADLTEPNALVQVDEVRPATVVPLTDGLSARLLSGVGRLSDTAPAGVFDKKFVHTDVLVVGAGRSGTAAAAAAASGGARVLLVSDDSMTAPIPGDELTVLPHTSAFGYYDQNYVLLLERRAAGQRVWHVRARRVVLATGARQRPLVFDNNDRPGIMLASAVSTYLNRYAAVGGSRFVLATVDDSAYAVARELIAAGVEVAAVVDSRDAAAVDLPGVEIITGACVVDTLAATGARVSGVVVASLDGSGRRTIAADTLAVSGGWSPDLHLFSQSRGTLRWSAQVAAFVPDVAAQAVTCVGAAAGLVSDEACVASGHRGGAEAAAAVGRPSTRTPGAVPADLFTPPRPVWAAPSGTAPTERQDAFVDLHRDATVADVHRALGTGMTSLEHVKRYTTIGTGHDQGATAGVNAAALVALALNGEHPGDAGTTTFRAPALPVSFVALAGRDRGHLFDPARTTALHRRHVEGGAVFEDVGQWKRPRYFPLPGESMDDAVLRECRAARTGVATMDATTLGKIEIVGADAGEFLNRIYTNAFARLPVGSARYGVMCTADGMVFDDGVTMRLTEDRFYLTTTTGGAARVLDWLEEWHQTEWAALDVAFTSVTEQWVTVAVVGPRSRDVIARLAPELDVSAEAFPFMTFRSTELASGVPARIARISFSGELAYEVNVASWFGVQVWDDVLAAGADLGITRYGTETMHVLRAEKGFPIVGQDTDGTVTPLDLGMAWIVSKKKDFVGKRSLTRPDNVRPDRKHLVGLFPEDPAFVLPEGAQLVAADVDLHPVTATARIPMLGHVTSSYRSAALGRSFALALVKGGRERLGETVLVPLEEGAVRATITEPVFYDPEGARRDG